MIEPVNIRKSLQREIDTWLDGKLPDKNIEIPQAYKVNESESYHFNITDMVIAANTELRDSEKVRRIRKLSPDMSYVFNFCIVRCGLGRVTGKTAYINSRADENSLILISDIRHKKLYHEHMPQVVTVEDINQGRMYGMHKPEIIYIEEPSMVFNGVSMYDVFCKLVDYKKEQTFVLLGA